MEKVNRIIEDETFKECLKKISDWEQTRQFCRHNTNHFLNVARIAMIINLEERFEIPKDWIYAAALLHDIGRFEQYETGTDHAKASARIAPEILKRVGFDKKETEVIVSAIANHRNKMMEKENTLNGLIYRADKLSRECYFCEVQKECDWSKEKKNLNLKI